MAPWCWLMGTPGAEQTDRLCFSAASEDLSASNRAVWLGFLVELLPWFSWNKCFTPTGGAVACSPPCPEDSLAAATCGISDRGHQSHSLRGMRTMMSHLPSLTGPSMWKSVEKAHRNGLSCPLPLLFFPSQTPWGLQETCLLCL